MSTLGLDDRENPADLFYYAPRQRRSGDEGSIRPVLERLRRSDTRDDSGPGPIRQVPGVEELVLPEGATLARDPFSFVGRLAIASAVAAALAITVVTLFEQRGPDHASAASAAPAEQSQQVQADQPKKVQTVSLKSDSRIAQEQPGSSTVARAAPANEVAPPAVQQDANVTERNDAVAAQAAAPRVESGGTATPPSNQFAMAPPETSPSAWNPVNKDAKDVAAAPPADSTTDETTPAETTPAKPAKHHVRHARRHRTTWHRGRHHHSANRAVAAQQPAGQVEQEAQAEPVKKNPIQSAIDSFLGRP